MQEPKFSNGKSFKRVWHVAQLLEALNELPPDMWLGFDHSTYSVDLVITKGPRFDEVMLSILEGGTVSGDDIGD